MKESVIERHLRLQVEKHGGLCWKFTSPGMVGVPDRIVIPKDGQMFFVETKAPGGVLSSKQKRRHAELRARKQIVEVWWTKEQINFYFP